MDVAYTNAVYAWGSDMTIRYPSNPVYVMPGYPITNDPDQQAFRDVTTTFYEGNDCQYIDIYRHPDLVDIGWEKNVYHTKVKAPYIMETSSVVYVPSFHNKKMPIGRDYYVETSWSTGSTWFMWRHVHEFDSSYMQYESWDIYQYDIAYDKYSRPYIISGFFFSHLFPRGSDVDFVADPLQVVMLHPEYKYKIGQSSLSIVSGVTLRRATSYNIPVRPLPQSLEVECSHEALNADRMNTNNIQNVLSIVDIVKVLSNPSKLPRMISDLKHLNTLPKASRLASDLWLKYRYVYKTSISDIQEVTRFLLRDHTSFQTYRGGKTTSDGTCRVKILATYQDDNSQYAGLQKYGLAPDLYNIWDSIPFSFVLDWFIGIGSFCESISNQQWAMKFSIHSRTTSWTYSGYTQSDIGPVQFKHYQRFVTPSLPSYMPYSSDTVSGKTCIKRVLDGTALFIGR